MRPPECDGCPLNPMAEGFAEPVGLGSNGVMLVGEALGEREAERSEPFVGPAGRLLSDAIERAGFARAQFTITNAIWCRPPDNKLSGMPYQPGAMRHCRAHYLEPLIRSVKPRVIVPLGDIALQSLTGLKGIQSARGYPFHAPEWDAIVLPSIHPAFVLKGNPAWKTILIHDIRRAVKVAAHGLPDPPDFELVLDPTCAVADEWVQQYLYALRADPAVRLAFDGEWPAKGIDEEGLVAEEDITDATITRWSLAYRRPGGRITALSTPWRDYEDIHALALRSAGEKVVWNKDADVPKLALNGIQPNGLIHDAMRAWHVLHSDLRKKLELAATFLVPEQPRWKHLSGAQPARYNALDSAIELLAMERLERHLRGTGLWAVYDEMIIQPAPAEAFMSAVGMPIDLERKREYSVMLDEKRHETLGALREHIPEEARRKRVMTRAPKAPKAGALVREIITDVPVKSCPKCGKTGKLTTKHPCVAQGVALETITAPAPRVLVIEPFKPSPPQLKTYADLKRHKMPHGSTDETALRTLMTQHPTDPVYPLVIDYREIQKLEGTYIGYPPSAAAEGYDSQGLPIGSDGRVHTTFTRDASTLRWTSKGPNMTNIPRGDTPLGALVRKMFVAPKGFEFVKRDFSGIEAILTAYFAGSRRMFRLAQIDLHTFVMAHAEYELHRSLRADEVPDFSWPDEQLRDALKGLKKRFGKPKRNLIKRVVHGHDYAMTARKAREVIFKDLGVLLPLKDINALLQVIDNLFPEVERWQHDLCHTLDATKFDKDDTRILRLGHGMTAGVNWIRSPFGAIHRFHNVLNWTKVCGKWQSEIGDGGKALIAFGPQHSAAVIGTRAVTRMWADEAWREYLRLFIHDELLGEAPVEHVESFDHALCAAMEQPVPELSLNETWGFGDQLVIKTEGGHGPCWGEIE